MGNIDFLEVSGGNYENMIAVTDSGPPMKDSTKKRYSLGRD